MKKLFLAASMLFALILFTGNAHAEETIMTMLTCKDFNEADSQDERMLYAYMMDGFLAAEGDTTTVTPTWVNYFVEFAGMYCPKNPNATFAEVFENLSGYDVDFGELTCEFFATLSHVEKVQLSGWWLGFLSFSQTPLVHDGDAFDRLLTDLNAYCPANPNALLKTYIETKFK